MKFDKDYVTKLASSLHIQLDDTLLETLVKDINELAGIDILSADLTYINPDFEKKINCSKLKEDKPVKTDVDALSSCKIANKYVVGK